MYSHTDDNSCKHHMWWESITNVSLGDNKVDSTCFTMFFAWVNEILRLKSIPPVLCPVIIYQSVCRQSNIYGNTFSLVFMNELECSPQVASIPRIHWCQVALFLMMRWFTCWKLATRVLPDLHTHPPPQLPDTKLERKTVPENLSPVIPGEPPAFQPSHAWASRIRGAGILQGLGWSLLHHPPPPFSPRHSLSAVPSRQRGRPEPEPCWGWGGRGEVRRIVN